MPDWTKSMTQTFEYYIVDPNTWYDVRRLYSVKSCTINRDSSAETLGSATIDIDETVGECYIRVYLITIQNDIRERHPLGTFLVQTPASSFNGKVRTISVDAYTPLLELKDNPPPLGYYVPKGANIMDTAYRLTRENLRAPVSKADNSNTLNFDFVADPSDTWLSFTSDLISNAKHTYGLDDMGRIIFQPKQDTASLQPVWTYTDDNSSILYPEFDMEHDLFEVPNVVEVIYSNGPYHYYSKKVNDDPNSPTSTVNRGREKLYRDTNPALAAIPTEHEVDEYATQLLRDLSSIEYTLTYTHGYCPVRLNDCIRFDYKRSGVTDVKAKVVKQSIKCIPGCPVTETAAFTKKLWG